MFKTIDSGPYSIKNVKTFKGMEGMGGFNLSLYKNGKRIGEVINDDSGGPHRYHVNMQELKELQEYAKVAMKEDGFEIEDLFVWKMLEDFENEKRFKKMAKKKTLFRTKDMKEGDWKTLNIAFCQKSLDYIKNKYGDNIESVLDQNLNNVLDN